MFEKDHSVHMICMIHRMDCETVYSAKQGLSYDTLKMTVHPFSWKLPSSTCKIFQ